MWKVSESLPELAQAVLGQALPGRVDIVRAKQHLLSQFSDGLPHPAGTLIASVAALLGAEPLGHPQIAAAGAPGNRPRQSERSTRPFLTASVLAGRYH
jgi:hypothetical protein